MDALAVEIAVRFRSRRSKAELIAVGYILSWAAGCFYSVPRIQQNVADGADGIGGGDATSDSGRTDFDPADPLPGDPGYPPETLLTFNSAATHTHGECIAAGGQIAFDDVSHETFCRFGQNELDNGACPASWVNADDWTTADSPPFAMGCPATLGPDATYGVSLDFCSPMLSWHVSVPAVPDTVSRFPGHAWSDTPVKSGPDYVCDEWAEAQSIPIFGEAECERWNLATDGTYFRVHDDDWSQIEYRCVSKAPASSGWLCVRSFLPRKTAATVISEIVVERGCY